MKTYYVDCNRLRDGEFGPRDDCDIKVVLFKDVLTNGIAFQEEMDALVAHIEVIKFSAERAMAQRDQHLEELAALREELAECKISRDYCNRVALHNKEIGESLKQLLTAAEQRNAELVELLRDIRDAPGGSQFNKHIDAALKPTESGASE